MQLNGSQIFVEVLCEQGVDTLFGYPGGAVLNLYDELYKNSDRITHVLTAHEQGASHAADGYARATGRTGVVLATSGPGATNLVTGIATAYMDSVPLVAFTGNVATSLLGRDSFQEAYIEGITMPITKHNFTVRRVEDLADTMRAAFRIAQSGRKGPVLVDIPKDVTANSCEFTHKEPELIRTVTRYNEEEVKDYVVSRLKSVNCRSDLFKDECYHTLYSMMNTSVRILNQLINKSLILGMHYNKETIDSELVMQASKELMLG